MAVPQTVAALLAGILATVTGQYVSGSFRTYSSCHGLTQHQRTASRNDFRRGFVCNWKRPSDIHWSVNTDSIVGYIHGFDWSW